MATSYITSIIHQKLSHHSQERKNIYQNKIDQLKEPFYLDRLVTEFKEKLMKSTQYEPTKVNYQGEHQTLEDAILKECIVYVVIEESDDGVLINY